ncbi:MAG: hypothetical protein ACRDTX_31035 [Pseudonocardiaceae bacterium]
MISGCYQNFAGNLRVIDAQAGQRCNLLEKQLDWNQAGVTGPKGGPGATGPSGPAGPQGPASEDQVFYESGQADAFAGGSFALHKAVPGGSYVVRAEVGVQGRSSGAIRCTLNPALGGHERTLFLSPSGASTFGSLELTVATITSGEGTLELICSNLTDQLTTMEATLLATKVASVG